MSKPPACTMRRPRAAPVRVSSALTRRLPYDIGGGRYGDRMSFLALIVVCAVAIYCVKRNNPASADDADAAMVPADSIANPTLFKRLLNA